MVAGAGLGGGASGSDIVGGGLVVVVAAVAAAVVVVVEVAVGSSALVTGSLSTPSWMVSQVSRPAAWHRQRT